MTDVPVQDIEFTYEAEYRRKQADSGRGFWAAVNSAFRFADISLYDRVVNRGLFSLVAVVPLALVSAVFPVVTVPVVATLGAAVAGLAGTSLAIIESRAREALKRDIANGTLVERYKEEVLKPRQERLEAQRRKAEEAAAAALQQAAPLAPVFAAEAAKPAETAASSAVPAAEPPAPQQ